jgi:uncharacterized tellurite resistance protein B-like protein
LQNRNLERLPPGAVPLYIEGRSSFEGVSMLDLLKEFLADVGLGEKPASRFDENDYRLAAAALLIHVSMIDGMISPGERDALHAVLKREFTLDDTATDELIEAAAQADREAVDLYSFTSLLNRSLDEDGRRRMVEMMWQIVFSDGRMNEFEDNIVWRASDLLGISARERVELRRSVSVDSKVSGGA